MLPRRKQVRLSCYDYSSPGAYFITICTHEKRCILSDITVGAIHESPAEVRLTEIGRCVQNVLEMLPVLYPNLTVDKYVIMPNHIHLLLQITEERAIRESPLQQEDEAPSQKRTRSLLDIAIGFLKMNSSKQIHMHCPNLIVWQRSYHDHIIRNENDYREIWNYIDTNPGRWRDDCFFIG